MYAKALPVLGGVWGGVDLVSGNFTMSEEYSHPRGHDLDVTPKLKFEPFLKVSIIHVS